MSFDVVPAVARGWRDTAAGNRKTAGRRLPLLFLGGLPLVIVDRTESAELMVQVALAPRGPGHLPPVITSANGQVLSMCARDRRVRDLFLSADLIHADGQPLVLASRLKCRTPLPERVATTDLFHDVAHLAEARGATFYLLGATAEVIERAAHNVRLRYPRLTIAGFRSGYYDTRDEGELLAQINAARPDILWVGMGVPAEQRFALGNRHRLSGVGLIKTSGGLFDFLSGKNRRAPPWMQAAGMEWLYRLALEPRRLLHRYMTTNPHAAYLLLTRRARVVPAGVTVAGLFQRAPGTPPQAIELPSPGPAAES